MKGAGKYFSNKRSEWSISRWRWTKKKVKEGSLGNLTDDTDVFSEGMESADCKQFYSAAWKIQSEKKIWSG